MDVAFIGFADKAYDVVKTLPTTTKIWTVNHGHKFGFRIDRLFELHQRKNLEDKNCYTDEMRDKHLGFLNTAHSFPVYMQEVHYPASVKYPLDEALELASGKRFASSFDYMAALAILEKVDQVEVHGFKMDFYETEYRYQKPNALYWIGRMEGAGIEVDADCLMPEMKLYGYEQAQMVGRHTLEEHQRRYDKQYDKFIGKANYWKGIFTERTKKGGNVNEAAEAVRTYEYSAAGAQAAARAMKHLIDACDLQE